MESKPVRIPALQLSEDAIIIFETDESSSPKPKKLGGSAVLSASTAAGGAAGGIRSPRAKGNLKRIIKGKLTSEKHGEEAHKEAKAPKETSSARSSPARASPTSTSAAQAEEQPLGAKLQARSLDNAVMAPGPEVDPVRRVKAATVPALVDHLTSAEHCDIAFRDTFLLTYRSFTTSLELMQLLLARFDSVGILTTVNPIQLRVVSALKAWIEDHWSYDFEGATELQNLLIRFIHKLSGTFWGARASQMSCIIERLMQADQTPTVDPRNLTKSLSADVDLPEHGRWEASLFEAVSPLEMARQVCLFDFETYRQIVPGELLGLKWSKKDKLTAAPNVCRLIQQFNIIVSAVTVAERVRVLQWMIDLGHHLLELNNFSSAVAVRSGINSSSVRRLKRTWAELGEEHDERFVALEAVTTSTMNYKVYRETIGACDPPAIPHIGVYLRDLTFVEDGNSDRLATGLINFSKCYKVASVITTIMRYQKLHYSTKFAVLPKYQQCLATLSHPPVEDIYERSKLVEPKEPLWSAYEQLLLKYDQLLQENPTKTRTGTASKIEHMGASAADLTFILASSADAAHVPLRCAPVPPAGAAIARSSVQAGKGRQRRRRALHRRSRSATNVLGKITLLLDTPKQQEEAAAKKAEKEESPREMTSLLKEGRKHSSEKLKRSAWSRATVSIEDSKSRQRFTRPELSTLLARERISRAMDDARKSLELTLVEADERRQRRCSAPRHSSESASSGCDDGYYSDDGYYDPEKEMEEAPQEEEEKVAEDAEEKAEEAADDGIMQEQLVLLRPSTAAQLRALQKRRTANFKHVKLQRTKHALWQ